ncbi:glycosyltransferase family 2 protein [Sphingomonas mollis]|uniref:Glycosyltransferase family 2 protein n=1 Tax=Sphingomonas mollis TaxID=2795726 RepID=A0ABS0XL52_9SPHN|nr:glycosyltransferase family 2 protein [Sphingomonas sp. BT553]MBJ6120763.1 glycosyltransferase family 2 protein [Sphingomonas sp. BT553]
MRRVSIAMCTYNGERYLRQQLDSFAAQERSPDEVVICDDGSTDGTETVVNVFRATVNFPVHFHRNPVNLGFARNFEKAASLTTGDLVFFSDQDDVWQPGKVAAMVEAFVRDDRVGLVFCDADLVDGDLAPIGLRYWHKQGFADALQDALESDIGARTLLRDPAQMAAGATMAYAARFAPSIFPLPDGWTHDAWIATIVAAQSKVVLIRQPLNQYRQHVAQVYGASSTPATRRQHAKARSGSADHFVQTAVRYEALLDRLAGRATLDPDFPTHIRGKIGHWRNRGALRARNRVVRCCVVAAELLRGRYAHYSQGLRSAAMDCLY